MIQVRKRNAAITLFFVGLVLVLFNYSFSLYPEDSLSGYPRASGVVERKRIEEFRSERTRWWKSRVTYYESAIYLENGTRFFVRAPTRSVADSALSGVRGGMPVDIWHLPDSEDERGFRIVNLESNGAAVLSIGTLLDAQDEKRQLLNLTSAFFFVAAFVCLWIGSRA